MKSVSGALATVLTGNVQLGASLFSFFLDVPLYLTNAGFNVAFDASDTLGVKTYESARAAVKRGRSKMSLSVAPDDVEITLALGSLANGANIRLAAARGNFDGRRVRVQKFFSSSYPGDTSAGAVTDVDGPGYVADVSSAELRLIVKSRTDLLSRPLPPRVIAPSCQWVLYGPGCLVDISAHSEPRIVTGGTSSAIVVSPAFTRAAAGGLVWFDTGANAGVQRNIGSISGGTILSPTVAFPFTPAIGDELWVARGCDRTRVACDGTFANSLRYGGFPDVPDATSKSKA